MRRFWEVDKDGNRREITNEEATRTAGTGKLQEEEPEGWNGSSDFLSTLTPLLKGRVSKTFLKAIRHRGQVYKLGDLITKLVSEGWRVKEGTMRILQEPSGIFLSQQDLTKTGLDYAEYLIRRDHQVECQDCQDTGVVVFEASDPQQSDQSEFCDCQAGKDAQKELEDFKSDPDYHSNYNW